jgi:hypothetical protein
MADEVNTKPEDLALQAFAMLIGVVNALEKKGALSTAEVDNLIVQTSKGYASEPDGGPKTTGAPLLDKWLEQRKANRA